MKVKSLNKYQVRHLILEAQCLRAKPPSSVTGIFDQLGYVQIDTLAVVQRSHHLTLWTRLPRYQPKLLDDLQRKKRQVFEYWTHAMSIVPMADYRYYLPRMRNFKKPTHKWVVDRLEQCEKYLKPVKKRIREEGPLGAKDFENPKGKNGSWWDWKPAKLALELLLWRGELMVAHRENFQKRYDLTERVLPEGTDTRMPTKGQVGRFIARRALVSMGVASQKDLCAYLQPGNSRDSDYHAVDRREVLAALGQLVEAKEIIPVQVEQDPETVHYALKSTLAQAGSEKKSKRVFLLSPFDSLIIQRQRALRMFGFAYALECYLPAAKRKFGYFTMPILWNSQLVGRLDPRADRKTDTLQILNLALEPGFKEIDSFLPALARKLLHFAIFNGCKRVHIQQTQSNKLTSILKEHLRTD